MKRRRRKAAIFYKPECMLNNLENCIPSNANMQILKDNSFLICCLILFNSIIN